MLYRKAKCMVLNHLQVKILPVLQEPVFLFGL